MAGFGDSFLSPSLPPSLEVDPEVPQFQLRVSRGFSWSAAVDAFRKCGQRQRQRGRLRQRRAATIFRLLL